MKYTKPTNLHLTSGHWLPFYACPTVEYNKDKKGFIILFTAKKFC